MVVLHGSANFTSRHVIRISPSAPIDPGCREVLLRLKDPEATPEGHMSPTVIAEAPSRRNSLQELPQKEDLRVHKTCDPLSRFFAVPCWIIQSSTWEGLTAMNALFYSR